MPEADDDRTKSESSETAASFPPVTPANSQSLSDADDSEELARVSGPIDEDLTPRPGVEVGQKSSTDLHDQRFRLALILLRIVAAATVGLIIAAAFVHGDQLEAVKSIASIVFGPLVTLLGTSFAWYFANKDSNE